MDDVSLVLFAADYAEPNREYEPSRALRVKAFKQPLVVTAREICAEKIEHLHRKNRGVHARSTRALWQSPTVGGEESSAGFSVRQARTAVPGVYRRWGTRIHWDRGSAGYAQCDWGLSA